MLFVVCLRPVPCVPNVVSVSGLFLLDCSFGFLERLFVANTSTDHVVVLSMFMFLRWCVDRLSGNASVQVFLLVVYFYLYCLVVEE